MPSNRIDYSKAAELIAAADPLVEVRITLAWDTSSGERRPILRLNSKSIIHYKHRAKPLGTVYDLVFTRSHSQLLLALGLAMSNLEDDADEGPE